MGRPPGIITKVRSNVNIDIKMKESLQILSIKTGKTLSTLVNEGLELIIDKYEKDGIYSSIQPEDTLTKERLFMQQPDGQQHDAKALVVTNNKGGVAKTTSCASLAILLGKQQKRVLIIDADMQGNLSTLFGYSISAQTTGLASYLKDFNDGFQQQAEESPDVTNYILPTNYKNVDIIRGDVRLNGPIEDSVKNITAEFDNPMTYLLDDIKALNIYDYIIIDTAPSMGILVTNFILSSDYAIIPTDVDLQGIEGARKISSFINRCGKRKGNNKVAKLLGTFFTRADLRTSMGKGIESFKSSFFEPDGIYCFKTFIPQSADVPTAIANGKPVAEMYPATKATKKYADLLEEVVTLIG